MILFHWKTDKNTYFNGVIEDYYEIVLQLPKPPSLNAFYAGRHWTSRTRAKESYFKSIEEELKEVPGFTAERFSLSVRYNCRFDVDNSIICIKFLADYLRNNDYVVDDTPKYFDVCQNKLGMIPNVLQAYAFDIDKLNAFTGLYNNLMLAASGLSKLEREMIAVVVSSINKCFYCQTAHGAAVRAGLST